MFAQIPNFEVNHAITPMFVLVDVFGDDVLTSMSQCYVFRVYLLPQKSNI
jgi:hypothetical protein